MTAKQLTNLYRHEVSCHFCPLSHQLPASLRSISRSSAKSTTDTIPGVPSVLRRTRLLRTTARLLRPPVERHVREPGLWNRSQDRRAQIHQISHPADDRLHEDAPPSGQLQQAAVLTKETHGMSQYRTRSKYFVFPLWPQPAESEEILSLPPPPPEGRINNKLLGGVWATSRASGQQAPLSLFKPRDALQKASVSCFHCSTDLLPEIKKNPTQEPT